MRLVARLTGISAALALLPAMGLAQRPASPVPSAAPSPAPVEGPLKHAPKPTVAAITPADLMTRLYIFADDSMLGREAGTLGGVKGTDYIARETRRLGLEPAGDSGTYFQHVPLVRTRLEPTSRVALDDGATLALGTDVQPLAPGAYTPFGMTGRLDGAQVIYGGRLGDPLTLTPEQLRGRVVLFAAARTASGARNPQFWQHAEALGGMEGPAAIAIATLDVTPPQLVAYFAGGAALTLRQDDAPTAVARPVGVLVSAAAAQRLLGASLDSAAVGATGRTLAGSVTWTHAPTEQPARNVVAILRGSDPSLRATYVAVGAHNDHDGVAARALDHDSLRVSNRYTRRGGAESPQRAATAAEQVKVTASLDSIRARRGVRRDSIMNGADDDGSGSMALLEVAEAMTRATTRPRRSVLFVWHTAEEKGLFGSEHYSDHPTVPRDSIVAGVNIDMIGRGGAFDEVTGGGMDYLQLIGSRRLSTQLGDLVEQVSRDRKYGFTFDYQFDANGHPAQYYCRSDHYNYARYGIPVVFMSTGGHQDYHMLTDEPQYIDYPHYAKVTNYAHDLVVALANLRGRPVVDKEKPDPNGSCKQ